MKKISDKKNSLQTKKSIAKYGMAASMGTLVATGLMGGKKAKAVHIASGAVLIGFSVWHYSLYSPQKKKV